MKQLKLFTFAVLLNILPLYSIAQDYDLLFNPVMNRPIYEPIPFPVLPPSKQLVADMRFLDTGKPKEEVTFENLMDQKLNQRIKNTPRSNFGGYYDARLDTRYDDPENRAFGVPSNPGFNKNKQRSLDDTEQQETGKSAEEETLESLFKKNISDLEKTTPDDAFMGYYDARLDAIYNDPENRAFGVYSSPVAPTSNHGSLGIVLGSILFIGCIGAFFWFNGKTE